MNKELKRALRGAVLSAGAWAENFQGNTLVTVFPPYVPAGVVALHRSGRPDLIPALRRRTDSLRWDVTSLADARRVAAEI